MRGMNVSPNRFAGTAIRAGERLGRIKPNGSLLRRVP